MVLSHPHPHHPPTHPPTRPRDFNRRNRSVDPKSCSAHSQSCDPTYLHALMAREPRLLISVLLEDPEIIKKKCYAQAVVRRVFSAKRIGIIHLFFFFRTSRAPGSSRSLHKICAAQERRQWTLAEGVALHSENYQHSI